MNSLRDIEGTEFDWFASDAAGQFALFSTGGAGPVPDFVRKAAAAHDNIGEAISVTDWGTPQVWSSYSRAGLFVYDWSPAQAAYVRVALPTNPPSTELLALISTCLGPVRLTDMLFADMAAVQPDWQNK